MLIPDEFPYDVFLSHSAQDKAVVRPLAERLRADGVSEKAEVKRLKDEIPLPPSYFIPHPFPSRSRVLVLCMSANAFGSDWAQLESGTFRFRNPLNKERRFLPLRLDDASIKGSLAQFLYINWLPANREQESEKLCEAGSSGCESICHDGTVSIASRAHCRKEGRASPQHAFGIPDLLASIKNPVASKTIAYLQ